MAIPDKSPMGKGQFGPRRLLSPLLIPFSPHAFTPLRQMSPLFSQSPIFLQSKLAEDPNSELLWINGIVDSAFHEHAFHSVEAAATTLDDPHAPLINHLLPSFGDDHLGLSSNRSGDGELVDFAGFTANVSNLTLSAEPEDLCVILSLASIVHDN